MCFFPQPGLTQTSLYNNIKRLTVRNFRRKQKRNCTILQAKTKALIRCAVHAQLICVIVLTYVKSRLAHDDAQLRLINVIYSLVLKGQDQSDNDT